MEIKYLLPVIPEDFIQDLKEQVLEVLRKEFVPLQEFLNIFADLEFLISNQVRGTQWFHTWLERTQTF